MGRDLGPGDGDAATIWVSSGVSHRTGKSSGLLDVSAARQFALNVIEAATAAEWDAALVTTLTGHGLSLPRAGTILTDMRQQRLGSKVVSARASVAVEQEEASE